MIATLAPDYLVHRFTVEQYHRLIEESILDESEKVELIEGLLVHQMTRKPLHDSTLDKLEDLLRARLSADWRLRSQKAITLADSEPEPDIAIVLGPANRYDQHHPEAAEIALLVEVAESSLTFDRTIKGRAYARANIPIYWVVNLEARQIEVYSDPVSLSGADPGYRTRTDFLRGQQVPVFIAGECSGHVAVNDIFA